MKTQTKKSLKMPFAFRVIRAAFGFLNTFLPILAKRWAVHLFFRPLRYPISKLELKIEKQGKVFSTQAGGKLIQGLTWGEGPVILLVHGWSGRGTQLWKFVNPLVQKGYKVVAFDAPAHGKSEGSETNILEWNELFQKIPGIFGEIEAVISHSFGGIATLFAMTEGLKIKRCPTFAAKGNIDYTELPNDN